MAYKPMWWGDALPSASSTGFNYAAPAPVDYTPPALGIIDPSIGNVMTPGSLRQTNWMDGLQDWWNTSGVAGKTLADGTKINGWGMPALSAASGLLNGWLGMQQLGVAKDTLAFNKDQYNKNYAAQQKTTNAELESRQAARVASNSGAYQSVGDYMKKYGI